MSSPFDGASASSLRALAAAFRSGQLSSGVSPLSISRVCVCPEEVSEAVCGLASEGMMPAHLALLLNSSAEAIEARMMGGAELVWTGPETTVAHSRDTAVVVSELFATARRSVLVSTFALFQASLVFKALADRMAEIPKLRAELFVHVGRSDRDTRHESEILREFADRLRKAWPGQIRPFLYYDPRSLSTGDGRATWHAKVVVIDDETSLVTSANFTQWAQDRNVEAGVLIRNAAFARQLRQQFDSLVQSRAVIEVPGFR